MPTKTTAQKFLFFAQTFILLFLFLLPIVFLPADILSLTSIKLLVVAYAVGIVSIVSALTVWLQKKVTLSVNLATLSLGFLVIVYFIATLLSDNFMISFVGRDLAIDSFLSILLFTALALVVGFTARTSKYQIVAMIATVIGVGILVGLWQLLHIVFPGLPAFDYFFIETSNSIGRWNDLALFAGLQAGLVALLLERTRLNKPLRVLMYISLIVNLALVFLANFALVWGLIGVTAILSFIHLFITKRKVAFFSIVLFALSLLFFVTNGWLGNQAAQLVHLQHVDVRPSAETTLTIAGRVIEEHPLFGLGPARFETLWPLHRPATVVLTSYWDTDFRFGFGLLPTFVATVGLVGIFPWVLLLVALGLGAIAAFRATIEDEQSRTLLVLSTFATAYLWMVVILYLPSTTLFALTFVFTGLYIALLEQLGIFKIKNIDTSKSFLARMVTGAFLLAGVLVLIFTTYQFTEKALAQYYFQKANIVLLQEPNDLAPVEVLLKKSLMLDQIDIYHRSYAETGRLELEALLIATTGGELPITETELQDLVRVAVNNYQAAIAYDPRNYNNYIDQGNFYRLLMLIGVDDAYELAKASYSNALDLKPNNPLVYLEFARLEAGRKDFVQARVAAEKAIEVKPNYLDAYFYLAEISRERGNTKQAIATLRKAVQNVPANPLAYFQLGFMLYVDGQYPAAINQFTTALRLAPQYDDAAYYLALSHYELAQYQEALEYLEILEERNPDNSLVSDLKRIIEEVSR